MRCARSFLLLLLLAGPAWGDDLGGARGDFRAAQKLEDWKERQDAYAVLAAYDGEDAAKEALAALEDEAHGAVLYAGVRCLAMMKSTGAQDVYRARVTSGKTRSRLLSLLALDAMRADKLDPLLEGLLGDKDARVVAQAAMALGRRQSLGSLPTLLPLLAHKTWQVRRAAAMALWALASPPAPVDPAAPGKLRTLPAPDAMKAPAVLAALADAMAAGVGCERTPMLRTLRKVSGQDFGLDSAAWRQLAVGKAPDEIVHKPATIPHVFGIPVLGRRVVVVFDKSLRMNDAHPYRAQGRLEALCAVPGARPIPWMRMTRARHFAGGHVKRLFQDMPKKSRMEVIFFNKTLEPLFGKPVAPGAGNRKKLDEALEKLKIDEGINVYDALTRALDLAGSKEARAWKSGPDEIVFVTVNVPTDGDVVDPTAVAQAIGFKARLRMVPIHTIGIHTHAYDMLRELAAQTGGTYRDYHK